MGYVRFFFLFFVSLPFLEGKAEVLEFSQNLEKWVSQFGCDDVKKVLFLGDVFVREDRFFEGSFDPLLPLLEKADEIVVNFEGVLSHEKKPYKEDKEFLLEQSIHLIPFLKKYGIHNVTLSNNHIYDYGHEGLMTTLQELEKHEMRYAGAGKNSESARRPLVLFSDPKVLLHSYSLTFPQEAWAHSQKSGTAYLSKEALLKFSENKKEKEYHFFSIHWGQEKTVKLKDYQKEIASFLNQKNILGVIGHHAHHFQPIEQKENTFVFYGLGNALFTSFAPRTLPSLGSFCFLCRRGEKLEAFPLLVFLEEGFVEGKWYSQLMTLKDYREKWLSLNKMIDPSFSFYFPLENKVLSWENIEKEDISLGKR